MSYMQKTVYIACILLMLTDFSQLYAGPDESSWLARNISLVVSAGICAASFVLCSQTEKLYKETKKKKPSQEDIQKLQAFRDMLQQNCDVLRQEKARHFAAVVTALSSYSSNL